MEVNNLKQLKNKVFLKQTVLSDIYNRSGKMSLKEYVNSWKSTAPENPKDFELFVSFFRARLERIYGGHFAQEASSQLAGNNLVSTIDHLGLLNHPFFLNANLIYSLKKDLKYIIVLPTAGVSLNNSSWPGCLVYSNGDNLKRLSFFNEKYKRHPVLAAPKLEEGGYAKVEKRINDSVFLNLDEKTKMRELSGLVFGSLEGKDTFSHQACFASSLLWEEFFPGAPKVVYVPLEEIVADYLRSRLADKTSFFYKLFFTLPGRDLLEQEFQGVEGAFINPLKGSFLYWGINSSGHREHLALREGSLFGKKILVEYNPGSLSSALKEGKIYPTSLVCFLVLLHCGVTCVGGFNQTNWLTNIKLKFSGLLKLMGEDAASRRVLKVVSDNFAESGLAYIPKGEGAASATGPDLYFKPGKDWFKKYHDLADSLTLAESIENRMPEIYRTITPHNSLVPHLAGLKDGDIAILNGSISKIREILV